MIGHQQQADQNLVDFIITYKTPNYRCKVAEGWEGASCCPGALRAKGQHEADVFVVSLYYVLLLSCICPVMSLFAASGV